MRLQIVVVVVLLLAASLIPAGGAVGVCWGTAASQALAPAKVVELLKANGLSRVRLSDAEPLVLEALSGSKLGVTVGIPNAMLRSLNASAAAARAWVHDNVTRYVSAPRTGAVRIEYITIGDEPFLGIYGEQFRPFVVGAATNIQAALRRANLEGQVKVVVPCSSDAFISESGLPSRGHFRVDLNETMLELLTFLTKHGSPFFANISPFLSFRQNRNISLDFALFKQTAKSHVDGRRTYKNSFDLSHDTLVAALSALGFSKIEIVIAQIGWPTDAAPNATSATAEAFMKGLTERLRSRSGTPLRPKSAPPEVYVLSLLDEDQRGAAGSGYERHWGLFTFDGQAKYRFDSGRGLRSLVNAQGVAYLPARWCVANDNGDLSNATAKAAEACSAADCSALSSGGSCSGVGWPGNVSYAFNSLYQQHDQAADSCNFGGLGLVTTVDPSIDTCRFRVGLRVSSSRSLRKGSTFWVVASVLAALA